VDGIDHQSPSTVPAMPFADVVTLADAANLPVGHIGEKVAALTAVRSGSVAVPDGFVVLSTALERAWESAGIIDRLDRLWQTVQDSDGADVAHAAREARRIIHGAGFDADLRREIIGQYHSLGADASVAVRVSVADVVDAAPQCAGVFAAHLGVIGDDILLARIRSCWASVFGERSLAMFARRLRRPRPALAILIQRMVGAERSGLLAPTDGTGELAIEATYGLSEPLLSGAVDPDRYVCDRDMEIIRHVSLGSKQIMLTTVSDSARHVFTPAELRGTAVLDQRRVASLCRLSAEVDQRLGGPHEIEWASIGDDYSVLQVRPMNAGFDDRSGRRFGVPGVLSGVGVGTGTARGRVRVITGQLDRSDALLADLHRTDILVVSTTDPTWAPIIRRVGGVITEHGDAHSHAALICRQLGIPAVVGTGRATTELHDGQVVSVDADRGWVIPHRQT
jgi:pyruvate,water dikinase